MMNMKPKMGEKKDHGKDGDMVEATEDSLKDRRMERGGVDGNNRYKKPISNTPNTFGKKKPKYDGMSAVEKVKTSIEKRYGKGAIKEATGKEEGTSDSAEDKDPCWKDYEMVGMKDKNGKKVPNCVPKGSNGEMEMYSEVNVPDGWSVSENVYKPE